MKISKKDIQLLQIVFGFGIAVLALLLVFNKFNDKRELLEVDNQVLQAQVEELERIEADTGRYIEMTGDMNAAANAILAKYPANVMLEDQIMYLVSQGNTADMLLNYINTPAAEETVYQPDTPMDEVMQKFTDVALIDNGIQMFRAPVSYGAEFTYDGMKAAIEDIYSGGIARSIDRVQLRYDQDKGNIIGELTFNMYFMTGTDKRYTPAGIPSMSTGTDNLFGSMDVLENRTGNPQAVNGEAIAQDFEELLKMADDLSQTIFDNSVGKVSPEEETAEETVDIQE